MVLEAFESARRPKCHVIASLSHVRRLESTRTPKKTPPSARGGETKPDVLRAMSAVFGIGGHFTDLWVMPPRRLFRIHPNPEPHGDFPRGKTDLPKKIKNKSPGGIELTTTRRPQQITMGSETMGDGLNRSTKGAPYFPHILVFFVVVWHVFAYQALPQVDTPVQL